MHTGHLVHTTLLAILVLAALPVHAVTLAEAVQASLERHPESRLAEARHKVEAGYRQQAESFLGGDPSVTLSATGDTFGSDFGYEEYVVGISLPVLLPGQRSARAAIADNLGRLADDDRKRLLWQVAGEVLERAWQLRIAHAELKESTKQWAAARALVQDIRHRHEVGEVSRNDLLLAQQDLITAEAGYQEARDALQKARIAWRNYTGLDALPDDLEAFSARKAEENLASHPRLAALVAQVETARARTADARARRRASPVVSLFAKRDRGDRNQDYTDSLGLEVSMPLGTGAPAAPAIAEAEAELTRAQASFDLARRELQLELARAEQEVARATRLHLLAERNHRLSLSRLKLAQRAFELGEMDLYQLLLARRQSYQATRELRLRKLEKARALARKNHVSGVIPR